MRIDFIEIRNFRRLAAIRIDFSGRTSLFVGANNSGKTSAITALRYFLIRQNAFSVFDIPLALWASINNLGTVFEKTKNEELHYKWEEFLPSLDVWLKVSEGEIHHVVHLIPTLDWNPDDGIGVRLQLEPKIPDEFLKAYLEAKEAACDTLNPKPPNGAHKSPAEEQEVAKVAEAKAEGQREGHCRKFALWPKSLMDFLKKRMSSFLTVNAYLLDPSQKAAPIDGVARPQKLPDDAEPLDDNPFKGLIKIDEVLAHRGFSDYSGTRGDGDAPDQDEKGSKQLLTAQLLAYYGKHLDPLKAPESSDICALQAIHDAEVAFDERLKDCFKKPLDELEELGYPGVANPRLLISSSLKPVEGLKHQSAVQYDVAPTHGDSTGSPYRLPEQCNGLGYQNLISMVFRLISFRDDWLKVGKAARTYEETGARQVSPPLCILSCWRSLKRICTCRCNRYSYAKLLKFCGTILTCKMRVRSRLSLWSALIPAISPMKSTLLPCVISGDILHAILKRRRLQPLSTCRKFSDRQMKQRVLFPVTCRRPMPICSLPMVRSWWKGLRNACSFRISFEIITKSCTVVMSLSWKLAEAMPIDWLR